MCFDPITLATAAVSAGTTIYSNMSQRQEREEQRTAQFRADLASYESDLLAYEQELAEHDARVLLYEADLLEQEAGFQVALSTFESYDARARQMETQAQMDRTAAMREFDAGEFDVQRMRRDMIRLESDQRARYLSSGVDIEGTPDAVMQASQEEGRREIETIRFNADTRAQAFRDRARLADMGAEESRRAGSAVLQQGVTLAGSPIPMPVTPPSFRSERPGAPRSSNDGLATALTTASALLPVGDAAGQTFSSSYRTHVRGARAPQVYSG